LVSKPRGGSGKILHQNKVLRKKGTCHLVLSECQGTGGEKPINDLADKDTP